MALSILIYHSASFVPLGWDTSSSSLVGKLGIYGVSIFFILSGLSMAHVYHSFFTGPKKIATFFTRRAFRIWPLLTFVVLLVAIPAWAEGNPFSGKLILANATGLFGLVWPSAYINVGAWSIGNEMVYYAFTPFVLVAFNRNRTIGNTLVAIAVLIGCAFAFLWMNKISTLADQWKTYINPFNNLFLYLSGIAIFYNLRSVEVRPSLRASLFIGPIMLFVLLPVSGDQINLVTGFNRIYLSLTAVMIAVSFYKFAPTLPKVCDQALRNLGHISYGVYLLHPFAIELAKYCIDGAAYPALFVSLVVLLTLAFAQIIYSLLEKPGIRLGKYVTQRRPFVSTSGLAIKQPTA